MPDPLKINGTEIAAGERRTVDLPVARLYTHTELTIPVHVVHGKTPGPRLFVSAAIHGDELNGVEIIYRLLRLAALNRLHGSLIAVPIVNVFGFLNHSRYLPDRRDLNRFFPGSGEGSLTSRLADLFMTEIVANSTHGIDLHTGSNHRFNLPQVRAALSHTENNRLAQAFGAPVMLDSNVRDGSLRQAVTENGIPMLLYEGGEAMRYDETAIRIGVRGIVHVMRAIGMLPKAGKQPRYKPLVARASAWARAPQSGVLRDDAPIGRRVRHKELLAVIAEPLGDRPVPLYAPCDGIVVGRTMLPLVNEGDALFHIADVKISSRTRDLEHLIIEPDPDLDRMDLDAMSRL